MSNKIFWFRFGSGDPRLYTGLTPTFLLFVANTGTTAAPPSIVEMFPGSGFYGSTYAVGGTQSFAFLLDGGSSVSEGRYLSGSFDPIINTDQELGFSTDSYGTTAMPSTVSGKANRSIQLFQADATFNKTTGTWNNYANGTSTLLISKVLVNSTTQVTKD